MDPCGSGSETSVGDPNDFFRIRIRILFYGPIRIRLLSKLFGLKDPDPAPDPSLIHTKLRKGVGDPNPNPKGSERFEGSESESDQTVRIWIRIRKDPNANVVYR